MAKDKITASGIIFDNGTQIMDDLLDFTIERHSEDMAAAQVYAGMRVRMAESRRNLRRLLKKGWFKGKEREKCLARARELREAELLIGCLVKTSEAAAEVNSTLLENIKDFPGMEELMSRFSISVKGKRRNR